MGLKPSEVIELWPVKIFFIILSVTLFYNFALANGALEKHAKATNQVGKRYRKKSDINFRFIT